MEGIKSDESEIWRLQNNHKFDFQCLGFMVQTLEIFNNFDMKNVENEVNFQC